MTRIGVLALVVVSVLCACSSPSSSVATVPSPSVSTSSSAVSSLTPSISGSPTEVAGLPVISVAGAYALLQSGKLDGQAVAVAGYFDAEYPPCPYPGRYIGPLESWCRIVAFTDTQATAQLCQSGGGGGMSCGEPSGTNLAPWFMTETSGDPSSFQPNGPPAEPVALVIIGHAGDARQWQCTAAIQAQCAHAFVVDRIVWANGHDVPPVAPQTGSESTGAPIAPSMTLAQVAASISAGDDLLTGAALQAGDVATVDPRWNLAGDKVVWLVRTLGSATESSSAETRPETEWLVDDATGKVIDRQPLKLAAGFQPARLWQMATAHGADCCAGSLAAFDRVVSSDGTVVYEGRVPGGESGDAGGTTFGGSYGSGPLVLPAGPYTVSAWLATDPNGVAGPPQGECSTQVTLEALGNVALNADFPLGKACTFGPAPSMTPGS
jgi:hypothetical protein